MGDIIERSLNLRVEGEDLASDMLVALGEQVTDLEQRVQTAFAGMASAAEDAASVIGEASQAWAPAWVSQLEELEGVTSGVFSAVASAAATAAGEAAGAADTVSTAWETQFAAMEAAAGTAAAEIDARLSGVGDEPGTNGSSVAASWSESLDKIIADAELVSGQVDGWLDGIGDTPATNGSSVAAEWSKSLGTLEGDAADAAKGVNGSLDSILDKIDAIGAEAGPAGAKLVTTFSDDFGKVVTDADGMVSKINTTLTGIDTDAAKVGSGMVTTFSDDFGKIVLDAKEAAGEIDTAFGVGAAGASEEGAAGAIVAKGTKGKAAAGGDEEAAGGLSIEGIFSKLFAPLLGTALTVGGAQASSNSVLSLGNFADQLGESITKAWQTELAVSYMGGNSKLETQLSRFQTQLGNIETTNPTLVQGNAENLGLGREGVEPASVKAALGASGNKGAAEGLALLFGSPQAAATQMQGMDPTTQLALIASKLDGIKNANERVQITNDLFGTRGGVSMLPLLTHFEKAMDAAGKYVDTTGKGTAEELAAMGGGKGQSQLESFSMSTAGTEMSVELALTKLDPVLESLEKGVVKLTTWLEKHLGGKTAHTVEHDLGAVNHALETGSVPKGDQINPVAPLNAAAKTVWDWITAPGDTAKPPPSLGTGSTTTSVEAIMAAVAKKYGLNAAGFIADSAAESGLIPNRVEGSTPSNPTVPTKNSTSDASGLFQFTSGTWAADYDKYMGLAAGTPPPGAAGTFSVAFQSEVAAAAMKSAGIGSEKDPKAAALDDITNFERPGKAGIVQDMTQATAFLQEMNATLTATKHTAASTTAALGHGGKWPGGLPLQQDFFEHMTDVGWKPFTNPAIQKELNAWPSGGPPSKSNITGMLSALQGDIGGETGKARTNEQQMIKDLEKMLDAGTATTKAKAPEIPKAMAVALNSLLQDAKTKLPQFTSEHEKAIEATLKILEAKKPEMTKTGADLIAGLIKGLQNQEGPLSAAAKKLAATLDSELKTALKIKSPSEMTAEIGEYLIDGLGAGITRSIPRAAGIAAHAGTSVARQLGTAPGGIAGGGFTGGPITIELYLDRALIGSVASDHLNSQMKLVMKTN